VAVSLAGYSSARYPITYIRKTRRLPLPGEVLAKKGDRVAPDTVVARINLRPGVPWVLPVARMIGIEPQDLPSAMLKQVGEMVKTKEIIARSSEKGLYGRKEYLSPTDGVIEEISPRSGRVTIREVFGKEEPPVKVDVAFEIGCSPKDLPKNMLVKVGQEVKKGAMLAKKGEMQAFMTKTCLSPITGVVTEIDDKTGYVTISRPFKEVITKAYLDGYVSEVIPDRGVVVETKGIRITGIFGLGRETHGELKMLVSSPDDVLEPGMIDQSLAGKIIVGGSFATNEALSKALEVGVKGVITGTASYLNLVKSLGVRLGVGITGQEDIPMTVILMEGFGKLDMHADAFNALKFLDGYPVSINGATQIRAGAIRPEIIASFPDYDGPVSQERVIDEELALGQRVRVINEPYFGAHGTVINLPRLPQRIETEAEVPVVELELDSGERVIVPRPNVEVF